MTRATSRVDVWDDIFNDFHDHWMRVHLKDGTQVTGWPDYYSLNPDKSELFLAEAELTRPDGTSYEVPGSGILLTEGGGVGQRTSSVKGTSSLEALRSALKSQYHPSLAMLRTVVRACPEDLWSSSNGHANPYWRIAYHTLHYTNLYLQPNSESFAPGNTTGGESSTWTDGERPGDRTPPGAARRATPEEPRAMPPLLPGAAWSSG